MTSPQLESIKFRDATDPCVSMDVSIMSDGGISITIDDADHYDYSSGHLGSSNGICLNAAQVDQLRAALS